MQNVHPEAEVIFWHVTHEKWALIQKGPLGHMLVKKISILIPDTSK